MHSQADAGSGQLSAFDLPNLSYDSDSYDSDSYDSDSYDSEDAVISAGSIIKVLRLCTYVYFSFAV
jgi:hypothetical protein